MADGYTSAERRANVAKQLRDRKGRWIEMGSIVKWREGFKTLSGEVGGVNPNGTVRVWVSENKKNPSAKTGHAVDPKKLEVIDAKATVPGKGLLPADYDDVPDSDDWDEGEDWSSPDPETSSPADYAVSAYTGMEYMQINPALRTGQVSELPEGLQRAVTDLSGLINGSRLSQPKTVYRGLRTRQQDRVDTVADLAVGSTLNDKAFMSTTENEEEASSWVDHYPDAKARAVVEISLATGQPALDVASYLRDNGLTKDVDGYGDQGEFVLPTDTSLKIISKFFDESSGVWRYRAVVVGQPEPLVADSYTSAERRANVKKQLRDRKGRWIDMGAKVRFLKDGEYQVGEVTGIDTDTGKASVTYRGKDGRPITSDLNEKALDVVAAKASLIPKPNAPAKPKAELPEADKSESKDKLGADLTREELEEEINDLKLEEDVLKEEGADKDEINAVRRDRLDLQKRLTELDGDTPDQTDKSSSGPDSADSTVDRSETDRSRDLDVDRSEIADLDPIDIFDIDDLHDGDRVHLDNTINGPDDIVDFTRDEGIWRGSNDVDELELDDDGLIDYIESRDPADLLVERVEAPADGEYTEEPAKSEDNTIAGVNVSDLTPEQRESLQKHADGLYQKAAESFPDGNVPDFLDGAVKIDIQNGADLYREGLTPGFDKPPAEDPWTAEERASAELLAGLEHKPNIVGNHESLSVYTGMGFYDVNQGLRSGNTGGNVAVPNGGESTILPVKDVIDDLDAMIAASPELPEPMVAYRGLHGVDVSPGDLITDKAFTSVSLSDKTAAGFAGDGLGAVLEISLPAGTKVRPVRSSDWTHDDRPTFTADSILGGEGELLLGRDVSVQVTGEETREIDGKSRKVLTAELVPTTQAEEAPTPAEDEDIIARSGLDPDTADDAVDRYTLNLYRDVNGKLRGLDFQPYDQIDQDIEALAALINASPATEARTLYRGISPKLSNSDAANSLISSIVPGAVISDAGFLSTTAEEDVALNSFVGGGKSPGVLFEIPLEPGDLAFDVDRFQNRDNPDWDPEFDEDGELEFILPPGSTWKVTQVTDDPSNPGLKRATLARAEAPAEQPPVLETVDALGVYDSDISTQVDGAPRGYDDGEYAEGLALYTEHGFVEMNKALRDSGGYDNLVPDDFADDQYALDAINQLRDLTRAYATDKPTTVYRSFNSGSPEAKALVDSMVPGATVTDHGFISTTKDPQQASSSLQNGTMTGVLLELNLPEGTRGVDVNAFFESLGDAAAYGQEEEFLLADGTSFRVTGRHTEDDGLEIISMEPVAAGPEQTEDTLAPEDGVVKYDADGRVYVSDANGVAVFEGDTVTSVKDGLTGTVAKVEPNGRYVQVQGTDGKKRGRRLTTLERADVEQTPVSTPGTEPAVETESKTAPSETPTAPAPSANDKRQYDDSGQPFVSSGSGDPIYVGAQVTSTRDGLSGTVVSLEKNGEYVQVLGEDGKKRGRKALTLGVAVSVEADTNEPAAESTDLSPMEYAAASVAAGDYEHSGSPDQGEMSTAEFIELPDGTRAFRKTVSPESFIGDPGEVGQQIRESVDAEVLSSLVASALGIDNVSSVAVPNTNDQLVSQLAPGIPAAEYIELIGEMPQYMNQVSGHHIFGEVKNGKEIALLDYLTVNQDRHLNNWFIDPDTDTATPIDHGVTFIEATVDSAAVSPFAEHFIGWVGNKLTIPPISESLWTAAELEALKGSLESLSSPFGALGRESWHKLLMERLDRLIAAGGHFE